MSLLYPLCLFGKLPSSAGLVGSHGGATRLTGRPGRPHPKALMLQVPWKDTVQPLSHSSGLCTGVSARARHNKQEGRAGPLGSPFALPPKLPPARAPAILCFPVGQMRPSQASFYEGRWQTQCQQSPSLGDKPSCAISDSCLSLF